MMLGIIITTVIIIIIVVIIVYVHKEQFISLSNTFRVVTKEMYNLLNVPIMA
jgi:hypothetical protein